MKKTYIKPIIEISSLHIECLLESFSLPKTGEVDDPSFGQVKSRNNYVEEIDEEIEMIINQENGEQDCLW
jgi:hypothetical protein